jgi:SAM-dependent methyltransferase
MTGDDRYEEIIRELYRGILKREPDDVYLRRRTLKLREDGIRGGLAQAIDDLLASEEYRRQSADPYRLAPNMLINSSREYLQRLNAEFASRIPPGSLILDVGAGAAPYRRLFDHAKYESADFEQVAKEYGDTTYVCDITSGIPVENDRFRYILFNQTLEHIKDPIKALHELYRVLAPGGTLLCTAPLLYEPHELPYDFFRYTPFAHRYMFEQVGFGIERIDWLEGFFGTCGYMLECIYRYAPLTVPDEKHPYSAWAKAFLSAFRPLALMAAGAFYRMDLSWKITNTGFPKNYVVFATKPAK